MVSIISFLAIGFLFGIKHAFDADHIAMVSLLSSRAKDTKNTFTQGLYWGIGHALVLIILGFLVLIIGVRLPAQMSFIFERIVAVFLIVLGSKTFWDFFRERKTLPQNGGLLHNHPPIGLHQHPYPSFIVGIIHGLAGSTALLVLFISFTKSAFLGMLYIIFFGLGMILAMALLSLAIGFLSLRAKASVQCVAAGISTLVGFVLLGGSKIIT